MINTFLATLSPMLVLFCCMVIGFIANKTKITPDNTATVLSKLENYFLVPALIINTFSKYCTVSSIKSGYKIIIFSLIATLTGIAIAFFLAKAFTKDAYRVNIYRYALSFANFAFMGNAIVPSILGEELLYNYMLYTLPLNIACYTYGIMLLIPKGENKEPVLKYLLNPIFISIIIGAGLGLSGAVNYMPGFLKNTISNCAVCMGPLAMILTGFVIGGYDIPKLLKNKKIYIATFLRLIVLPAFFIVFLKLLGADSTVLKLTLFGFGTPLGLNTVVFPAAYGGDTKTGASMAMISHTLCVITIPIMYALLSVFVK